MVLAASGVLVTSDEATIVFLRFLDDALGGPDKFVVRVLDGRNLLVKAEGVPYVKGKLQERLLETVFDEDEAAGQPIVAQP
jgi:hypothetical protein